MPAHPQRPRPSPPPVRFRHRPPCPLAARVMRPGLLALACAALLVAGLAAAPAEAGDFKGRASIAKRQGTVGHDASFRVAFRFGDRDRGRDHHHARDRHHHRRGHDAIGRDHHRGHRDWGRGRHGGHHTRESGHHRRHIDHSRCGGYYKIVRTPPVYHTRYDACGRPYRVLVRRGGVKRFWVAQCSHGLSACR